MTTPIEERIMSMRFDNRDFNKNIDQTIEKLDKFEESTKMDKVNNGGHGLKALIEQFTQLAHVVSPAMVTLDQISQRFQHAAQSAQQFVKSLSYDQMSAGMSKYEEKVRSVYTIATATGKTVDEVNAELDQLMWFTDETSYSFSDMVNNIGKFTSQGVELGDAISAMEGISTAAALAGQQTDAAARAMYNFSQAMGVGSVKLMDWRSIENANMATKEFKEVFIDTAQTMGILDKNGKTKKGTAVTYANFSSTLAEGWFTSDVLLKGLQRYGDYAKKLQDYMIENDIDTAAEAMRRMGAAGDELGYKAFKAAQQARTFSDAINATKDAVSTGWLKTFEIILGDTDEATELFSYITEVLYDIFAAGAKARNEVLGLWKDMGGRETLLKGLQSIFETISGLVSGIKEAFWSMFPERTTEDWANTLVRFSESVNAFSFKLKGLFGVEEVEHQMGSLERQVSSLDEALERGAEGEGVKKMQKRLLELGYSVGGSGADGIFGKDTLRAVVDFQEAVGLEPTGIYDQKTHEKILSLLWQEAAAAGQFAEEDSLIFGNRGDDVKQMQESLSELGYDIGRAGADGIFGKDTQKALEEFQTAAGLEPTGVFDPATYEALYKQLYGIQDEALTISDTVGGPGYKTIQEIVQNIGHVLSIVWKVLVGVGTAALNIFGQVISALQPLWDLFVDIASSVTGIFSGWFDGAEEIDVATAIMEVATPIVEKFADVVQVLADGLRILFFGIDSVEDTSGPLSYFVALRQVIDDFVNNEWVQKIISSFKKFFNFLDIFKFGPQLRSMWRQAWTRGLDYFKSGDIKKDLKALGDTFKQAFNLSFGWVKDTDLYKQFDKFFGPFRERGLEYLTSGDFGKTVQAAIYETYPNVQEADKAFSTAGTQMSEMWLRFKQQGFSYITSGAFSKDAARIRQTIFKAFDLLSGGKLSERITAIKTALDGFRAKVGDWFHENYPYIYDGVKTFGRVPGMMSVMWKRFRKKGFSYITDGSFARDANNVWKTIKLGINQFTNGRFFNEIEESYASFGMSLGIPESEVIESQSSFERAADVLGGMWSSFKKKGFSYITDGSFTSDLSSVWTEFKSGISVWFKGIGNSIREGVKEKFPNLYKLIFSKITDFSDSDSTSLIDRVGKAFATIREKIRAFYTKFRKAIEMIFNAPSEAFGGENTANMSFFERIKFVFRMLFGKKNDAEAETSEIEEEGNQVTSFFDRIRTAIDWVWGKVKTGFKMVVKKIMLLFGIKSTSEEEQEIDDTISNQPTFFDRIRNAIRNAFTKVGDFFKNLFGGSDSDAVSEVENASSSQPTLFSRLKTAVRNFITRIVDFFKNIFGKSDSETAAEVESAADGKTSVFERIRTTARSVITSVSGFFRNIFGGSETEAVSEIESATSTQPTLFERIKNAIKRAIEGISNFFKNLFGGSGSDENAADSGIESATKSGTNFFTWFKEKAGGFFSSIATAFSTFIGLPQVESLDSNADTFTDIFQGIYDGLVTLFPIITNLVGAFEHFFNSTRTVSAITSRFKKKDPLGLVKVAGLILSIAVAVGIISFCIYKLGSMDTGSWVKGMIAIGVILGALFGFLILASKLTKPSVLSDPFAKDGKGKTNNPANSILKIAESLLIVAVAVGIIALSIKFLGSMDGKTLAKGILGFALIMGALLVFLAILKKMKATKINLTGLIELGVAIGIIALVAWLIGNANWKKMAKGMVFVGIILVMLAGFVILISKFKATKVKYAGLISLAAAVAILAGVMIILGAIPTRMLIKGGLALAALILAMAALTALAKFIQKNKVDIKPLYLIVGVIALLALIMKELSGIPAEKADVAIKLMATIVGVIATIAVVSMLANKLGGGAKGMAKGAAGVAAAFAIVTGIALAVVAGLGALNDAGGGNYLVSKVDSGAAVLKSLASALDVMGDPISSAEAAGIALAAFEIVGVTGPTYVVKGAAAIGGAFAIAVGIALAVVAGIGYINENGGETTLKEAVDSGGKVLASLADAINVFDFEDPMNMLTTAASIIAGFAAVGFLASGQTILGSAAVSAAFTIAVGIALAVVAGIGYINENGGETTLREAVDSGGKVLTSLADAINVFDFKDPMDMLTAAAGTIAGFAAVGAIGGLSTIIGAAAIGAAFAIIVGIATAVLAGLGAINDIGGEDTVIHAIEDGGRVLASIGGALGGFVAAFKMVVGGNEDTKKLDASSLQELQDSGITSESLEPSLDTMDTVATFMDKLGGYKHLDRAPGMVALLFGENTAFDTVLMGITSLVKVFTSQQDTLENLPEINEEMETRLDDILDYMDSIAKFMNKIGGYKNLDRAPGLVSALWSENTAFDTVLLGIGSMVAAFAGDESLGIPGLNLEGMPEITQEMKDKLDDILGLMDSVAKFMNDVSSKYKDIEHNTGPLTALFADATTFDTVLAGVGSIIAMFTGEDFVMPDIRVQDTLSFGNIMLMLTSIAGFMNSLSELNIEKIPSWFERLTGDQTDFEVVVISCLSTIDAFNGVKTKMDEAQVDTDLAARFGIIIGMLTQIATLMGVVSKIKRTDDNYDYADMFGFLEVMTQHLMDYQVVTSDTDFTTYIAGISAVAEQYAIIASSLVEIAKYVDKGGNLDQVVDYANSVVEALGTTNEGTKDASDSMASALTTATADGIVSSTSVSDAVTTLISSSVNAAMGFYNRFKTTGMNLVAGLATGIRSNTALSTGAMRYLIQQTITAGEKAAGIESPSKVTHQMGVYLDQGLAKGIHDEANATQRSALSTVGGLMASLSSLLADGIDTTPTITPVLDLSDVSKGVSLLNGYLSSRSIDISTTGGIAASIRREGGSSSVGSSSSSSVVDAINELRKDVNNLKTTLTTMDVVMETGALVGQLGPRMDGYLGHRAAMERRRGK